MVYFTGSADNKAVAILKSNKPGNYKIMKIEDLFLAAAEDNTGKYLNKLIQELRKHQDLKVPDIAPHIDFLAENWADNLEGRRAEFCLEVAALDPADSPIFRRAVVESLKHLLPHFLNKSIFFRALGARDHNVPLTKVYKRCKTLLKLKNGLNVFLDKPPRWGILGNIDGVTTSLGITLLSGGGSLAIPLEIALSEAYFFEPGPDTLKLSGFDPRTQFSANEYRDTATRKSILPIDIENIKQIALASLTPKNFSTLADFEAWWDRSSNNISSDLRRSCAARSIEEMYSLLKAESAEPVAFSDDELDQIKHFFMRLKSDVALREGAKLAECVAMMVPRIDLKSAAIEIFDPLKGKAPFLPAMECDPDMKKVAIMAEIPVKSLESVAELLHHSYSGPVLAGLACALPLRCINAICDPEDAEFTSAVSALPRLSCDIMVWIFRNNKKVGEKLTEKITIDQVLHALGREKLPKAWQPAQRELRKLLLNKTEFHKLLIANAGDDISAITSALQNSASFGGGEQQSLLVKLARISEKVRSHIENGVGEKILASKQNDIDQQSPPEQLFTSILSHNAMRKELQELINKHQPENRESLKNARALGDFRENSEYDAAKERRNFLSRRRSELEYDLSTIQPMDFKNVMVRDRVIIGSCVEVENENGDRETYYMLGARDGVPEKNWISYKTRMGEAILGKTSGQRTTLPDGTKCTIIKVSPLPLEIINILNGE